MPSSLGTFIRERRQDLGLTQEELAERIGGTMRQAEISRLEHDRVMLPRRDRLEAIAAALDVSLGALLVQSGWMTGGDGLADATATALRRGQGTDQELEAVSAEDALILAEMVTAVEELVASAMVALAEAQETLVTVRRTMRLATSPRGEVHVPAGVLDHWETAATFEA